MDSFNKVCEDLEARIIDKDRDRNIIQLAKNVKALSNGILRLLRNNDDNTLKSILIEIKNS